MIGFISNCEDDNSTAVKKKEIYFTAGLILLLLVVNWSALNALYVFWWNSATYGHGLLMIPVSAYLIWSNRQKLRGIQIKPSLLALGLIAIAQIFWWVSYVIDVAVVQQLLLLLTVILVWWACLGANALMLYIFPLVFPFVAIPIWDPIEPLLQFLTANMAAAGLELSGVPVHIQGYYITIPAGRFEIKEVCAGLRFFLAALTVAALFAYLYLRAMKWRLVFILAALVLAIMNNWIRVYAVVLAAHETGMQHVWVNDHVGLGWWLFVFMLVPLFVFGYYLHRYEDRLVEAGHNKQPLLKKTVYLNNGLASKSISVYVGILLVVVASVVSAHWVKDRQHSNESDLPALSIPSTLKTWRDTKFSNDSWRPVSVGADALLFSIYENANREKIYVYTARYEQQYQGKELINYNNTISNKQVWRADFIRARELILENAGRLPVAEYKLVGIGNKERLVWSCYVVNGFATTSASMAKLLQIPELLGTKKGAHMIAFSTDLVVSEDHARAILADYIDEVFPALKTLFGITS